MTNKTIRLIKIWYYGRIGLAKRMKRWHEYRELFFANYGYYPTTYHVIEIIVARQRQLVKNLRRKFQWKSYEQQRPTE